MGRKAVGEEYINYVLECVKHDKSDNSTMVINLISCLRDENYSLKQDLTSLRKKFIKEHLNNKEDLPDEVIERELGAIEHGIIT